MMLNLELLIEEHIEVAIVLFPDSSLLPVESLFTEEHGDEVLLVTSSSDMLGSDQIFSLADLIDSGTGVVKGDTMTTA